MASDCCSICNQVFSSATNSMLLTPCKGRFHEHCVKNWCETALECPECCGQQEHCRQQYQHLQMDQFPSVCSKIEQENGAEDNPVQSVVDDHSSKKLPDTSCVASSDDIQALCEEFKALEAAQQMISDHWGRIKQRLQKVTEDLKNK